MTNLTDDELSFLSRRKDVDNVLDFAAFNEMREYTYKPKISYSEYIILVKRIKEVL